MMRDIKHIVIHCSASANGDAGVDRARIDEWHRAKGWRGIGYHYVIEVDGRRSPGRPLDQIGAHVAGANADSIGICMVGTDRFSWSQWDELRVLARELVDRFPGVRLLGHRDFSPDLNGDGVIEPWEWFKTCPGFDVASWHASGMDPDWDPKHLYLAPQAAPRGAQAGFSLVQAAAAVAIVGAITALFFGAKAYVEDVRTEAADAGRRAALLEVAERDNTQLQAVQARVLALQAELAAAEQRHRDAVARIDQEGTDALKKAEKDRDDARRRAALYAGRLRDPGGAAAAACPAGGGGDAAPAALAGAGVDPGGDRAGGRELSDQAGGFLRNEADRADEVVAKLNRAIVQLEGCQQVARDDRRL